MRTSSVLFLSLVLCLGVVRHTQAQSVLSTPFTVKEKLSHYSVMALYQDERGLIWIGTRNGLNVYDGNGIAVYKQDRDNPHSLQNNSIRDLAGDGNGHIYILTIRGVDMFDLRHETFTTLTQQDVDAMSFDGHLYIAVKNKVYVHNGTQFKPFFELPEKAARIFSLKADAQKLYVGTEGQGLYIYDTRDHSLEHPIASGKISGIFGDSRSRLWVGTWEDGLYCLEGGSVRNYRNTPGKPAAICSNFIRACCEDKQGNIWVGTFTGLCKYSPEKDVFISYEGAGHNRSNLAHASVWSLLCDRQGTVWVGTYFEGMSSFNPTLDFYQYYGVSAEEGKGLSCPVVGAMTEDDRHNLWICTEGGGLNRFDRRTGTFTWYRHVPGANSISHNNVKSVYYDRERQTLWLGTHMGGLNSLDLRTGRFENFLCHTQRHAADGVNTICDIEPCDGGLLLATHDGVYRFDMREHTFRPLFKDEVNGRSVISFALDLQTDREGRLWIAGEKGGVYRYDFATDELKFYTHNQAEKNSLSSNGVHCIFMDSGGELWFCMAESGLDRYRPETDDFDNFNEKDHHLLSDYVYGACEMDPGRLLLITDNGFSCFDRNTGRFRNFDARNGLPLAVINQNAVFRAESGEVFIGGLDGLVAFRPADLDVTPHAGQIFPYKLYVNGREVLPGDDTGILQRALSDTPALRLKAGQSMFSVMYAVTDYVPHNRNEIVYKLENFSDDWTVMRNGNMITYTNLNPGTYTLLVKAGADRPDATASRLEIEVRPPLYRTPWAIAAYLLLATAVIYTLVNTYMKRLRLQTELKYERKHIRSIEELNETKLRFFTNISHEFCTPLTLINGQIEMLLQARSLPPAVYNKILSLYKSSVQLRELVNELLDFRKQEQGHMKIKAAEHNIVDFLYESYLLFREYAGTRHIVFLFNKSNNCIPVWYDAKQLQKVVNNLLSNAFRHTPDGGEIALSVRKEQNEVVVEVTDNGDGISEQDMKHVFERFYQAEPSSSASGGGFGIGLSLSKGIVELHHGRVDVASLPGEGAKFLFALPLGKAHFSDEQLASEETAETEHEPIVKMRPEMPEDVLAEPFDERDYTVLIVEDEEGLRNMLIDIFRPYYSVLAAADGEQGWEMAKKQKADIIVSDVRMPGLSGTELCCRVKQDAETCHIPFVLLTARTGVECVLEGLKTGADDYVTKPFDVNMLLARCRNLINNRMLLQEKYSRQPQKQSKIMAINPADKEFMNKAAKVIDEHLGDPDFNMNVFASELGIARTKLFIKLKAITNQTPNDYILSIRMKKAAWFLKNNPELNISEIADRLGFCSPRYFSRCFKERFGVTPQAYRRGEGEFKANVVGGEGEE